MTVDDRARLGFAAAEHTRLPSDVADAVVVAQAFHWFANRDALREICRILKPEGALVLVWNTRDSNDPFMERLYAVLAPHRQQSPGHESTPWRELFEGDSAPLRVVSEKTFYWEEPITLHHLKGRVRSTSYVALLDAGTQRALVNELENLVGSTADDATVLMRHKTEVFVARCLKTTGATLDNT